MSLLQISEPNEGKTPRQKKLAVGIDLGTTNSLVAAYKNGQPVALCDEHGHIILPSVVQYKKNQVVVGEEAKEQSVLDPLNTIVSAKRLIGRGIDDIKHIGKQLPYEFSTTTGMPKIKTVAGDISPVQASSEILKALKQRAEKTFDDKLMGAVITVPAYFDEAQRQATKDAAKLAGINVLRLLSEPTAAAVAYGLDQEEEGIHAIYDLGGGTFDISILNLTHGIFEVMATGGDSALGGDDMDHAVAEWVCSQAGIKQEDLDHKAVRTLLHLARIVKEDLTLNENVNFSFQAWSGELTRAQFNKLIHPLVERTLLACKQAMKDKKIALKEIKAVVLVGGATRIPYIREKIAEFFQQKPLTDIDPDQVVAIGAAVQAEVLSGNKTDDEMLLLDVLPLSLGLETMGGLAEKIVDRNTTIPVTCAQEFTTYKDGQTAMMIHVVQGERELISDCRSLAQFELTGIPPMKAGAAKIRIEFQVDADGLLSVIAVEKSTGVEAGIQVKPSYGLSDDEIESMLTASFSHAEEDIHLRVLTEEKVETRQMLELLEKAIAEDGDKYLSDKEKNDLETKMKALNKVVETDDHQIIRAARETLDEASQNFAQRRMSGNLREALKGKHIGDFDDA